MRNPARTLLNLRGDRTARGPARRLREGHAGSAQTNSDGNGGELVMRNESSRVLTVKELSDYLKVHPSTIYRQLKRGRLPAFKVGSDWRFNIESIDRWRLEQDNLADAR
jgi:excisionase family DNA binding protein